MRCCDNREGTELDNAVILAEGVLGTTHGKTANGLIRYSRRFRINAVIDSFLKGSDAGTIVTGKRCGVPVVGSLDEVKPENVDCLIVGAATDGGFLPPAYRPFIRDALERGISVVSGLHEFLGEDREFRGVAARSRAQITDVRKLFRDRRNVFTGRISEVKSTKIAVLGTDSAVGKRTAAIRLNDAVSERGFTSSVVGTGQTSWMQGIPHTIVMDAIVNDFVAGALESATYEAWKDGNPGFLFLEGQGSIMHPAYPGGFEIIGACRPDAIILQHAPKRIDYDGFPGFRIPPLETYVRILELLSGKKVIAISLNTEQMTAGEIEEYIEGAMEKFGIPAFNPLSEALRIPPEIVEAVTQ